MFQRCFILVLLFFQGCTSEPDVSLRIGSNQWPGYEPLYLAQTLGFHDNTNLKLIELTSSTEVMNAFRLGQLDVAALTMDEVFLLADIEQDLVVFLVMDISNGADKLIVTPELDSLTKLKHKKIGVENTALGAYFLSCILAANDLKHTDISVIPGTIDQHQSMLTSGQVDAVVTFDPVASQLIARGYRSLFDSSQLPGKIVDVLVTRRSLLKEKTHLFKQLMDAHWQAITYFKNHPDEATNIMAPRLHISPEQLKQSFAELILPDQARNKSLLNSTLSQSADTLNDVMLKQGMLEHRIDVSHLISDEMLP